MKNRTNYTFNIITIGESTVGKTSVVDAFIEEKGSSSNLATIGVEFKNKKIDIDDLSIKLKICDTAGQERFRNLTMQYYRDAKGIVLVYDMTNQNTFDNLEYWISQIKNNTSQEEVCIILLGNKIDLENERVISENKGKVLAQQLNAKFFETSALKNINITEAFHSLIRDMVAKNKLNKSKTEVKELKRIDQQENVKVKSKKFWDNC